MYGRLAADVEMKKTKSGKDYAVMGIYTPVSSFKENEGKKNEDVYYNLVCVNQEELKKIKSMDLKKGDTINFIGSLSSYSYENKDGKKIVRPKYFIEYIDLKKGKEAQLYAFMDDTITSAIGNFEFMLRSAEEIKQEEAQKRKESADDVESDDDEYTDIDDISISINDVMPF